VKQERCSRGKEAGEDLRLSNKMSVQLRVNLVQMDFDSLGPILSIFEVASIFSPICPDL
jgi:hypothetical protein